MLVETASAVALLLTPVVDAVVVGTGPLPDPMPGLARECDEPLAVAGGLTIVFCADYAPGDARRR